MLEYLSSKKSLCKEHFYILTVCGNISACEESTAHPVIPQGSLALCAGLAVAAGMDEEKAWKSITLIPAQAIGVSDRVGSLEFGKDADIVIFSGNPLRDIDSSVVVTIVDGKVVYRK
jgi:imidazolonepropionase-like amidohydrolase